MIILLTFSKRPEDVEFIHYIFKHSSNVSMSNWAKCETGTSAFELSRDAYAACFLTPVSSLSQMSQSFCGVLCRCNFLREDFNDREYAAG